MAQAQVGVIGVNINITSDDVVVYFRIHPAASARPMTDTYEIQMTVDDNDEHCIWYNSCKRIAPIIRPYLSWQAEEQLEPSAATSS